MNKNILKFERPGCAPCKVVDTILDKHNIKVTKVDIIENPALSFEYEVRTVPTLILLDHENKIIKRVIGASEEDILELNELMNE